jgi:glycosyltransferase involved in cell wall biosynthesis
MNGAAERPAPRVTLGIATYNRDTYLGAAIESALAQDYDDFELLVVCDGSANPAIDAVLAGYADDSRLRVVRHEQNQGIAAAYNTFVSAGRGELIAMIGDDDLCMPDRLRRQVAVFDAHPDTGIVHGDATVIDADGVTVGAWPSRDFESAELVAAFFRSHNHLVDPTRMVHRRVYEAVGGYDASYPLAQDFDFWLRAAREFRFRHCPGGPLVAVRRHGENASDESLRAREVADVERALEAALERYTLRELLPELDWALLDPIEGERAGLERLATLFEARLLPLPGLAARMRERAAALEAPVARRGTGSAGARGGSAGAGAGAGACAPRAKRIVITAFGWNDSGGGTTVPRLAAKELARRGWEVSVFYAAVERTPSGRPYEIRTSSEDGVQLIGVHNRPSVLFDLGQPERELHDPAIATAFAALLDRAAPDVIHFHNLHNLGASLFDEAAARGIPSFFSTHNYWLICPRAYLMNGAGEICAGPGDRGGDCASCVGSADRSLTACLAVSDAVRTTLVGSGYAPELVDVVRQAMPHEEEIWTQVGAGRTPGRQAEKLTVAFVGSAYPHKGPALLIEAAQRTEAEIAVRIIGEVPERYAAQLRALDQRGVVEFHGAYAPAQLAPLLAQSDVAALPSLWWDCAPLAAAECLAARLPLVVPRLAGLAEAVRDEVDGLLFDGLDAADLARQLDRLASETGLLERLQAGIEPPRAFAAYIDELEAYYRGERPGRAELDADAPDAAPPAVRWQGDHGLALSLSIVNHEVTQRLPGPVQRVARDGTAYGADAPLPHTADVEVRHHWPPDLRPAPSGRLALIQPWEFGAIPRDWLAPLRENVDELWVPSDFVRQMYLSAGLDPARVVTIPNGVDLDRFSPDGARFELDTEPAVTRFLYHGGLIWRKGHDVLLAAWREAFAGRDDVVLIIKDVGVSGVYRNGEREGVRAYAGSGELPRVLLLDDELDTESLASLYRACDVLVAPYRGEGFAMPVLEAMACGVPVIATAGGPTDEFCPPGAGWRINATRAQFPDDRVDALETVGRPWVLEPDPVHLGALLREAAGDADGREARGRAARAAAEKLSWDAVAEHYAQRIAGLAGRRPLSAGPPAPQPYPLSDGGGLRVLATPAWRGTDRLPQLLAEWATPAARHSGASLVLLADPNVDGDAAALEARVLEAARSGGCDLDSAGDINILMEPQSAARDRRLHAAIDAYVLLHHGAPGHERLAAEFETPVLEPGAGSIAALLETDFVAVD